MPWMFVRRRRRRYGFRRFRSFRRRSFGRGRMRRFASGYRRFSFTRRGRGRYRGRAYRGAREVRLVIQTPSDMLPPRPVSGQFARVRRRSRF